MEPDQPNVNVNQDTRKLLVELQTALYSIGEGVIIADTDGYITRINPVACNLTGWQEGKALGKHVDDVFHLVDKTSGVKIESQKCDSLHKGKTAVNDKEILLTSKDGNLRPIVVSKAPIFDEQEKNSIGMVLSFHDKTAERESQQAQIENEDKFRTIFEIARDGLLIADAKTKKFLHGNAAICSMLGYSAEEIKNLTVFDIHPKAEISSVLSEFERQAKEEKIIAENVPMLRKNKEIFYADISSGSAIIGGKPYVLGIFRDITERKLIEEERQTHLLFLKNLERIDQAIKKEVDVEQMLRNILETVFAIFDCDRTWLLGPCDPDAKSFRIPMEITKPEYPGSGILNTDIPMPPGMSATLRRALLAGKPVTFIPETDNSIETESAKQFGIQSMMLVPLHPKLGKPWAFGIHQCSYPRVWTNDEIKLFTEIARRISDGLNNVLFLRELQENEERFRATFEQAAVGIAHFAPDGRWLRVNQKLCNIAGYSKEEMLKMTFQDITEPEDMVDSIENVRRLAAGEIEKYSIEKRFVCKSGSIAWVNETVSIVRCPAGKPDYLISVIEEIAKRKHAEKEQEKLQQQLIQIQKMESVGRLAGGIAHDFNNVLGVILGQSELALLKMNPNHPQQHNLKEILKASRRAADLTRQLLAFARKQTVFPKVVNLNEIVDDMLSMLRRLIGEDIDLTWQPCRNLGNIKIDPGQVDQIMANLFVNARDACLGNGKITVETNNVSLDIAYCNTHPEASPGEYVILTVSDSGSGMKKEVLENIFEPFFTTKEVGKGTGLGLATVYGIVKQNMGFIKVYSQPGVGSTFKIAFPRCMIEQEQIIENGQPANLKGGTETILLVEDELPLLNLAKDLLESLGYRVLSTSNPAEAIKIAAESAGNIDLLFTDVVMPEMNGKELYLKLRLGQPDLKSLFMSGYSADIITHRSILEEGVCFIQKPFSLESLSINIREALENNSENDEQDCPNSF